MYATGHSSHRFQPERGVAACPPGHAFRAPRPLRRLVRGRWNAGGIVRRLAFVIGHHASKSRQRSAAAYLLGRSMRTMIAIVYVGELLGGDAREGGELCRYQPRSAAADVQRKRGAVRWVILVLGVPLAYIGVLSLVRGTAVRHVRGAGADGAPVAPDEREFPLAVAMLTGARRRTLQPSFVAPEAGRERVRSLSDVFCDVSSRRREHHVGRLFFVATGSDQPRRIAAMRMTKHTDAPAIAVGTGGQWSECPATTTAAPASAAMA